MNLRETVEAAWSDRTLLNQDKVKKAIHEVVEQLDKGQLRVAQKVDEKWMVNDWIKKAVILYFPIRQMETIEVPPFELQRKGDPRGSPCGGEVRCLYLQGCHYDAFVYQYWCLRR